jgi:hypothetical protein
MPQQSINMSFQFNKPLATVFADLSNHELFGKICGIKMTTIQKGKDGACGLGSVRKINIGPLPSFEETITEFRADEFIEYKITRGSPIKNHVGTLRFKDQGDGCSLDYQIKLESKIPFTTGLIKSVLKQGISKGISSYAAA